ncbi:hypothetical protein BU15DRAFT_81466 [Melanogaster broomeanus]|nr:hypothetical protein BU15DRAFT_81466 [Melanogaster broomeanus]
MALHLQFKGYVIRWATYSKGGFKDGVLLTVDDELNRWQKVRIWCVTREAGGMHTYGTNLPVPGCNELIFNPLIDCAPVHYKFSMMAYMFSYYGIAAAAALSLLNYLLLRFQVDIDEYFLHSFEVWLACTVVFPRLVNLGFALLEYLFGHRTLLSSLVENLKWVPFLYVSLLPSRIFTPLPESLPSHSVRTRPIPIRSHTPHSSFFGGLSIYLSVALLTHLFSYNIMWGTTKKQVKKSNFFIEVPRIWQRFRLALVLCGVVAAGDGRPQLEMVLVPAEWTVDLGDWAVIFPIA